MVTTRVLVTVAVFGAACGVGVSACTQFDRQLQRYCERNTAPDGRSLCTCEDAGLKDLNVNIDCWVNDGFPCGKDEHCLSRRCVKDGGPDGVCWDVSAADGGSEPFDAGIQCSVTGAGLVPCGACLDAGNCDTCQMADGCQDGLICSAAHTDGGPGVCKTGECFQNSAGGFYCGWRTGSDAELSIDGGDRVLRCVLPGAFVGSGGNPCCYYRGPLGEVLQCDSPDVPACACDDGGVSCWAVDAGQCPL